MGTRQRSARVDWVAADFPSKDAAKRTGRHFVFQRCERETRQHIKAELPGSCSQSKFNRGSSTLTHPASILYICLSDWLSCRRFTQKRKPGMIYLHVCVVVWLQKRPQQSAPSLAAAPASLHQVANMQEAGGSRSFQLRSQSRRSGMFRQGWVRVMDKTCWKASSSVPGSCWGCCSFHVSDTVQYRHIPQYLAVVVVGENP